VPIIHAGKQKLRGMSMETVTYSQLQELVMRLPAKKLPTAYRLLVELSVGEIDSPSLQQAFMLLPLAERRRLMAEQAEQIMVHYAQMTAERQAWQAGDFVDY
jgi:hypothetical protein